MTRIPNEVVIPPSPNWYLSGVFECHKKSGVLAYAASRCLVFLKPHEENIGFPSTRVIPDAHRNKITCEFINSLSMLYCQSCFNHILSVCRCILVPAFR